jgi:hypothetical protein
MRRVDIQARHQQQANREETIQNALLAIQNSGRKPNGHFTLSVKDAALLYGIPRTTLTGRIFGAKSHTEAHVDQQNLTPPQEQLLVGWIQVHGKRAIGMRYSTINDCASDICGFRVGETYATRFVTRYPELKGKMTTALEVCRAQALNFNNVSGFYDILSEVCQNFNI